jgi:hypothetical protein
MSKKFERLIKETVARWRETITSTTAPDAKSARELLQKAFPNTKKLQFFEVRSPAEFYIAQAVIRGRMAKKAATEFAESIGIDPLFIKPLTKLGSPVPLTTRQTRWAQPTDTTNTTLAVLQRQFEQTTGKISERRPLPATYSGARTVTQLIDLEGVYRLVLPVARNNMKPEERNAINHRDWRLNFVAAQKHVALAHYSIFDAVSGYIDDIMAGEHHPERHRFDAIHAEIVCKAIGCKTPAVNWPAEIFHHIPAFMQFRDAYLMLVDKPVLAINADEQLHNVTGPAIVWPDNKKLWYVDGHYLAQHGEQIVMAPETLTKDMILDIENEEERRVAIDRMGWHKYLSAIGAKITHSRENWVDNTFEVLIDPPELRERPWNRSEPLRMVLSCRSTGRKYFIAVPRSVPHPENPERRRPWAVGNSAFPDMTIDTCEKAQKWLADGATNSQLDFAKYPINVIGAS